MAHYCLTTRRTGIKRGNRVFYAEPGEPLYLVAPDDAAAFAPEHELTGPKDRRPIKWAKQIVDEANISGNPDHPSGDIVFIVHGYNVDEKDAFLSHKKIQEGLAAHGLGHAICVSYDWPARGGFLNYLEDDSDARETAIHLMRAGISLFAKFTEPDCRIRVHVMAHSMGNLVVREAFRAAGGFPGTREAAWGVTQLILFGADISSGSLTNEDGARLFENAQRVTSYYNRHDKALATSNVKRFLSSPRLGRHGAPDEVLDKIVDVDCSDRWIEISKSHSDGLLANIPLSHTFYTGDDIWMADLVYTLRGDLDRLKIPTRQLHPNGSKRMQLKPSLP